MKTVCDFIETKVPRTILFPGYREHTVEERKCYSNFIDSFFEEVEIREGPLGNKEKVGSISSRKGKHD